MEGLYKSSDESEARAMSKSSQEASPQSLLKMVSRLLVDLSSSVFTSWYSTYAFAFACPLQ